MEKISIYSAGPLFNIATRHHNLLLARELEALGYSVILPQKEAMRFFDGQKFDVAAICEDCEDKAMTTPVIIANIDGADADSGTSNEVGVARATKKLAEKLSDIPWVWNPVIICVRTDFRTDLEKEIGYNAMFNKADKLIYKPAFVNSLDEVAVFYKELAREIDKAIKEVFAARNGKGEE